jgi:hypothetical protein
VAYAFPLVRTDTPSAGSPDEQLITLDVTIENIASAKRVHYHPVALALSDSEGYVYKPEEVAGTPARSFVAGGQKEDGGVGDVSPSGRGQRAAADLHASGGD